MNTYKYRHARCESTNKTHVQTITYVKCTRKYQYKMYKAHSGRSL